MGIHLSRTEIDTIAPIVRRAAPRLRLSIPARVVSLGGASSSIMINLSRSGALVGMDSPLKLGEDAVLYFAGFERFGTVSRERAGMNAFMFEDALSDEQVLAERRYSERYQDEERRDLSEAVAAWVAGRG